MPTFNKKSIIHIGQFSAQVTVKQNKRWTENKNARAHPAQNHSKHMVTSCK